MDSSQPPRPGEGETFTPRELGREGVPGFAIGLKLPGSGPSGRSRAPFLPLRGFRRGEGPSPPEAAKDPFEAVGELSKRKVGDTTTADHFQDTWKPSGPQARDQALAPSAPRGAGASLLCPPTGGRRSIT